MKKVLFILLIAGMFASQACQETEFTPKESPENGVLSIKFKGQLSAPTIILVPAMDTEKRNEITLSLAPDVDFEQIEIEGITVSKGAQASIKTGDKLDLTTEQSFTVTAENGLIRTFYVLPPARFNMRRGGDPVISNGLSMYPGEWLCYGQNRTWDVTEKGDTIGFFRCNMVNGNNPTIDNTGVNKYLTTAPGDDYFIFKSNGTYEFSYGKDGVHNVLTAGVSPGLEYAQYLLKSGKGYWEIVKSKNGGGADTWGVSLYDKETKETYLFNFVNIATDGLALVRWPTGKNAIRVLYKFNTSLADANWQQYIVIE